MARGRTRRRLLVGLAPAVAGTAALALLRSRLTPEPCYLCRGPGRPLGACRPRAGGTAAAPAALRRAGPEEGGGPEDDWRDFRARLVARERAEEGVAGLGKQGSAELSGSGEALDVEGWAYSTPLVEQGSLLLSRPGGRFTVSQQYFHKAVIFIVNHRSQGDLGLILNRPTTLTSAQLGLPGPPWAVWFGGDCQGIASLREGNGRGGVAAFCLHTVEEHASVSQEVISGVYLLDFGDAFGLVQGGTARPGDFLLLLGYCGWGAGQLQRELARGGVWTLASVDKRLVIRELRQAPGQAGESGASGAGELLGDPAPDDGTAVWQRLYAALGSEYREELERAGLDDSLADTMLQQWVQANLKRPRE